MSDGKRVWSISCPYTQDDGRKFRGENAREAVLLWSRSRTTMKVDSFYEDSDKGEPEYWQGFLRISGWQTEGFEVEELRDPRFPNVAYTIRECNRLESDATTEELQWQGRLIAAVRAKEVLKATGFKTEELERAIGFYRRRETEARTSAETFSTLREDAELWKAGSLV